MHVTFGLGRSKSFCALNLHLTNGHTLSNVTAVPSALDFNTISSQQVNSKVVSFVCRAVVCLRFQTRLIIGMGNREKIDVVIMN